MAADRLPFLPTAVDSIDGLEACCLDARLRPIGACTPLRCCDDGTPSAVYSAATVPGASARVADAEGCRSGRLSSLSKARLALRWLAEPPPASHARRLRCFPAHEARPRCQWHVLAATLTSHSC